MKPALVVAGALAVLLAFGWAYKAVGRADARVQVAEARADSARVLRVELERRARADSMALDSARGAAIVQEARIKEERALLRRVAAQASLKADSASGALRATLDSLGASTADLDRLIASFAAEVRAKDQEIEQADSLAAARLTLLQATEQALASERASRAGFALENDALRDQIAAMKSAGRRSQIVNGVVILGVVTVAVLR